MENNRAFTGMWIPAAIWLHDDLNITEKCLIAEIVSLNNNAGGCFASNAHFSKFLNLSKNRISAILSSLQERGWIRLINERRNNQIIKRQIFIAFNYGPTGMPTPKAKKGENEQNEDVPNTVEGIPPTEGGIPNTDEGVPPTDEPLPYSEGGIPNSRKVNSHLNNHLNNQLNNQDHKQGDQEEFNKPESLRFYESNGFGTLSSIVIESITEWMKDFEELGASQKESDELIKQALTISAYENKRTWRYTNGTLKNWHNAGLYTIDMVEAAEKERKAKQQYTPKNNTYNKSNARNESLPEWAKDGYQPEPDRPLSQEEKEEAEKKRKDRLAEHKAKMQELKEARNQQNAGEIKTDKSQPVPELDEMFQGLFNG